MPSVITQDPEVLGGAPVFSGARVPVKSLLDYLQADRSLGEFLDDFPSVSRGQAVAALEEGVAGLRTSPAEGKPRIGNGP